MLNIKRLTIVAISLLLFVTTAFAAKETVTRRHIFSAYLVQIDCYDPAVDNADTDNKITVTFYDGNKVLGKATKSIGNGGVFNILQMVGTGDDFRVSTGSKNHPTCSKFEDAAYMLPIAKGQKLNITNVRIETNGNDGFWMDEVRLRRVSLTEKTTHLNNDLDSKYRSNERSDVELAWWGRDGGLGYCLSTDYKDGLGNWGPHVDRCTKYVNFNPKTMKATAPRTASAASKSSWKLCGTEKCITCSKAHCKGQNYSRLDRDKDKSDLKRCPSGYAQSSYQKHPQTIVADVYLRVCSK